MATKIQARRDTAANWTSVNPVLASGEIGYETDAHGLKFGNGVSTWNSLSYFSGTSGTSIQALAADLTALTNSTTLTPVTGLAPSVGTSATEVWLLKYYLLVVSANQTMDVQFGLTVPTAATARWGATGGNQSSATSWGGSSTTTNPSLLATETGTIALGTGPSNAGPVGFALTALVFGGGTAGSVQLKYAQNTADPGSLQILKGSLVETIKVSA